MTPSCHPLPRGDAAPRARLAKGWRRRGRECQDARPWAEVLPRIDAAALAADGFRRRLQRRLASLPSDLPARIAQALAEVLPLEIRPQPRLELTLVNPEGERRKLSMERRRTVVGRDTNCDIRLPSPAVAPRQFEIRLEHNGAGLLALAPGLVLDGTTIDSDQLRPLGQGSVIDLPPYRVVVGQLVGQLESAPVRLEPRSIAPLLATESLSSLLPGCLWLRLTYGDWRGFAAVPKAWAILAERAFGLQPSSGPESSAGHRGFDEVDRALLSFALRRAASRLQQLSGVDTEIAGPWLAQQAEALAWRSQQGAPWAAAHVDLTLGGVAGETAIAWPEPASARHVMGLDRVVATISVDAGFTVLTRVDVDNLTPGDVVLPDCWYAGKPWPPTPGDAPSGGTQHDAQVKAPEAIPQLPEVRLRLPGQTGSDRIAEGQLIVGEGLQVRLTTGWRLQRLEESKGDEMNTASANPNADLQATDLQGTEPQGADSATDGQISASSGAITQETAIDTGTATNTVSKVGDELPVTLAFELQRLTVPIGELRQWQEGEAIELDCGPDDPIQIVLHHPGGGRVLGHGRVVMLEQRLGIVVDSWAAPPTSAAPKGSDG